jgi:hypothetical protein
MNKSKTIWMIVGAIVVIGAAIALAGKYSGNPTGAGGYVPPTGTGVGSTTANVATPSATASSSAGGKGSITFQKFYGGSSFSFNYPNSWNIFNPSPFSINNFGDYDKDGAIPPGGAEIDIATTTLFSGRVADIEGTELLGGTNIVKSTATVGGVSCDEARYASTYTGGIISTNTAVYCLRGNELWKIYLSYRAKDSKASDSMGAFNTVLASFKFLP